MRLLAIGTLEGQEFIWVDVHADGQWSQNPRMEDETHVQHLIKSACRTPSHATREAMRLTRSNDMLADPKQYVDMISIPWGSASTKQNMGTLQGHTV